MNEKDFNIILERRLRLIREVLAAKADEYAKDDRLHNFKRAAEIDQSKTPAQVCAGFMLKHIVSVLDLVDDDAAGKLVRVKMRDEKIGDAINYLILLEALLSEGE